MKHSSRLMVAAALALLPFACSSNDSASVSSSLEAGAGAGGKGGHAGSTGAAGADAGPPVTCGGTECTLPIGGGIERLKACCTSDGKCGLLEPGIDKCLPRDMPGTQTAPGCPRPTFKTPGGDTLGPCCGPNGCGALDPFLGCVPGPELGVAAVACTYDPTNDCTSLTAITCDGAEDCPTGKLCCGKLVGASYVEVGCYDSCAALVDGGSQFRWLQLCHAGDTCENSAFSCLASTVLPAPLARCDASPGSAASATADKSAHHVDCGKNVCGTGEKCCMRAPHDPYCAPASDPCECKPTLSDAGGTNTITPDASPDSSTGTRDASPDSSTGTRDASPVPAPADASRG